jgi:hypothetical protein
MVDSSITKWESFMWYRPLPLDRCEVELDPGTPPDPDATNLIGAQGWPAHEVIRRKSDRMQTYYPHEDEPTLFKEFANTDDTPEAIADFVSRYGYLGGRWNPEPENIRAESVSQILAVKAKVKKGLEWCDRGDGLFVAAAINTEIKPIEIGMIDTSNPNRLVPASMPVTLEGLIWLQVRDYICQGRKLKNCAWEGCIKSFYIGKGSGTRAKVFHSPKCKMAFTRKYGSYTKWKETEK